MVIENFEIEQAAVMRAAVIQFPGSNCDRDMAVAIREVMGAETSLVWHRESELPAGS